MYSCVVRTEHVDREESIDRINVCVSVCHWKYWVGGGWAVVDLSPPSGVQKCRKRGGRRKQNGKAQLFSNTTFRKGRVFLTVLCCVLLHMHSVQSAAQWF